MIPGFAPAQIPVGPMYECWWAHYWLDLLMLCTCQCLAAEKMCVVPPGSFPHTLSRAHTRSEFARVASALLPKNKNVWRDRQRGQGIFRVDLNSANAPEIRARR